jgi:hypothetical protein
MFEIDTPTEIAGVAAAGLAAFLAIVVGLGLRALNRYDRKSYKQLWRTRCDDTD